MHYQEPDEVGLTEQDMKPAMAGFQAYAHDLRAGDTRTPATGGQSN